MDEPRWWWQARGNVAVAGGRRMTAGEERLGDGGRCAKRSWADGLRGGTRRDKCRVVRLLICGGEVEKMALLWSGSVTT